MTSDTFGHARARSRAARLRAPNAHLVGSITKLDAVSATSALLIQLGAVGYRVAASHRRGYCTLRVTGGTNTVVVEKKSWQEAWTSMRTQLHQLSAGQLAIKGGRFVPA